MKIIYEGGEGEIVEKKSRFICTVRPVSTEEEAVSFIAEMKKKYWDARHNCSAFVVGERGEIARFSDDGEPQGTAGKPMLDILMVKEIRNVAVVVTRYFGGVLLGTGGLIRAYQAAVQEGLSCSVVLEKHQGEKFSVHTDYNGMGKLQYLAATEGYHILDTIYTDAVDIVFLVSMEQKEAMVKKITEATAGRATIESEGEVGYGLGENGEVIFI